MSATQNTSRSTLWLLLLFFTAVALSAGCMLWFMLQAMRNEQAAIRKNMERLYLGIAREKVALALEKHFSKLQKKLFAATPEATEKLLPEYYNQCNNAPLVISSLAFSHTKKKYIWHYPHEEANTARSTPEELHQALTLEFIKRDYEKAGYIYAQYIKDPKLSVQAYTGLARCSLKSGQENKALKIYKMIAAENIINIPENDRILIAQAQVVLIGLLLKKPSPINIKLIKETAKEGLCNFQIPTATKVFLREEIMKTLDTSPLSNRFKTEINLLKYLTTYGRTALLMQKALPKKTPGNWQHPINRLPEKNNLIGWLYTNPDNLTKLLVLSPAVFTDTIKKNIRQITEKDIYIEITSPSENFSKGTDEYIVSFPENKHSVSSDQKELLGSIPMKGAFSGWTVRVFLTGNILDENVNRKRNSYLAIALTGISIMILLLIIIGVKMVRQARINRLKNTFLATVSHELKTPLASMRLLVDTIRQGNYDSEETVKEYLDLIARENIRLSRLIDNFLSFSRMERNKYSMNFELVSANDICSDAISAMEQKFNSNECDFSFLPDASAPQFVADYDATVTVLCNLLDNACKYSEKPRKISLEVSHSENEISFVVSDNGIGMTLKQQQQIYDKFYQADTSLARRTEGCGLGMSIVRHIVNAHNGKISINSFPDKGTSISVIIPLHGSGR